MTDELAELVGITDELAEAAPALSGDAPASGVPAKIKRRPTVYDPAIAVELCRLIAEGWPLNQIVRQREDMSWKRVVSEWRRDHPDFAAKLAAARDAQADHYAEEIVEIADNGSNDWMEREVAGGRIVSVPNPELVQRSRLRIESRKWLAEHMAPQRYGERVAVAGVPGEPLVVAHRLVVDRVMAALTQGEGVMIDQDGNDVSGEGET